MERKGFIADPKYQYHFPNEKNMIIVPITKIMEIIMSIHIFSFHEWPLFICKMIERKAFLENPMHQYRVSQ